MSAQTTRIPTTVPGVVHIVGGWCWSIPDWNVTHVVILGRMTAIIAHVILGTVGGHRRRMGTVPRHTSGANSSKTTRDPVIRWVVTEAQRATRLANKVRPRMFLLGHSIFDIFRVKGEVGSVGQETLPIAPAHERCYDDEHKDQDGQSSESKDKPRKGFIFKEGFSLGSILGASTRRIRSG